MVGLSGDASVIALVNLSNKIASLCFKYSVAGKNIKHDIRRLQGGVSRIRDVLEEFDGLDGPEKVQLLTTQKLSDSLKGCVLQLEELSRRLEPSNTSKAMCWLGLRALKWPFRGREAGEIVAILERYHQTFSLALSLALEFPAVFLLLFGNPKMNPATKKTDNLHHKIDPAEPTVAVGPSLDSHMEGRNAKVSDGMGMADLYKPLKKAPFGWQEIRLFSLFPGTHDSSIRGRLFQTRMEDNLMDDSVEVNSYSACNPAYEALSYVWGNRSAIPSHTGFVRCLGSAEASWT
ncbi:hypothetical protein K469DRAFT_680658 [Zopfia rhizophila CBS 207.26]|uniref:Fungal N-terminal domain-containing protein n=1 Tax=Zopfia rhizophila CBS 207.26 TaxID=1314779 RepID=A0A6A6D903_9PEZI|nr:hypothetical protein K469DRAFT_680658 [Zopfia rhizophila CBS 207.26]